MNRISFSQAKKLKEINKMIECKWYYTRHGELKQFTDSQPSQPNLYGHFYAAPLLEDVFLLLKD